MPGTVSFYLRQKNKTTGENVIRLQFKYHGNTFGYFPGERVNAKNWNKKSQRVKDDQYSAVDGSYKLNSHLDRLRDQVLKVYNETLAQTSQPPTPIALKNHLDAFLYKVTDNEKVVASKPTLFKLIDRFIDGGIGTKSAGTLATYRTAKRNLEAFQKESKFPVDFSTVTVDFAFAYIKFLEKKKLSVNSISKELKNVRTFMNMAVELEYTTNLSFKKKQFKVKEIEVDGVYLTDTELRQLYKVDFSDNKRLEAVRDFFVFNSYVGLRYSDASRIRPENIVKQDGELVIKIIPEKTKGSGRPVIIPCVDIVLDIFKKYEHQPNRLPAAISREKYNNYLTEVCQKSELFNETGRLADDLDKQLYNCITSKTARRNFATNFYLMGMDIQMLMLITGHTTEAMFKKYVKVTRSENAKQLREKFKEVSELRKLKAV